MSRFVGVQQDILNSLEKNQLVSAGAGSGKTTVMIQKIADLILKENVDIDKLLVVTFTVLAAEEMKQRLIKKLTEEISLNSDKTEFILEIIEKIKTANIDTIDGFSSKTIKKYFYELEISPNIEIVSDASRDYYLTCAMRQTIDELKKSTEEVDMLLDLYGGNRRSLEEIESLLLTAYNNVINLENPQEFFAMAEDEYFNSSKSEYVVNNKICYVINNLKEQIICSYSSFESKIKTKLDEIVATLAEFNNKLSLKHNLALFKNLNISTFSSKMVKENVGLEDINLAIKKIDKLQKTFEENKIDLDFEEKNEKTAKILAIFIKNLKIFIKNYNLIKENNNVIDFNDLTRLMLKLLKNDNIKEELQQKFKYVFIDEYQDVNPLQEGVLSQLVGENSTLFMVGDVKQSIYGFRGANPDEFIKKYNNLKNGDLIGQAFDMNLNFRSNPTILKFINELFACIMTKQSTGIDYKNDCMIEPKRDDIVDAKVHIALFGAEEKDSEPVGVYSVKTEGEKEIVKEADAECKYVLKTITELIGTDFYDANEQRNRKITYSDIAILSRSEKDEKAQMLIALLKENGVPLTITNKLEVQKSDAIKLVLSILKCAALICDEVDLMATLYSLTNLTIDELITIRDSSKSFIENINECTNENVISGLSIIEDIRVNSYTKSNKDLIRYILDTHRLKYYILRQVNGEVSLNLLEEFLNKISSVENSLGLAEFISVVESNISKGGDFASMDTEDSVIFQTIHKSKGLEYPVVILFNSGKTIPSDTDAINFNSGIGLGLDYFNSEERTKQPSIVKYAISEKNKQKYYKEEMRLLYVALTRAKNKLYITGGYTKKALTEKEFAMNNYVNMILTCFSDRITSDINEFENCVIEVIDGFDVKVEKEEVKNKSVVSVNADFKYGNEDKFKIPFKNSVTAINSMASEERDFNTKQVFSSSVQYNAEEDKAIIGVHYHKALELLDFGSEYQQNTNFEDVDYNKIKKAHEVISPIVKNAVKIKKEAEFMMYVPYNSVVSSAVSDKVLIQGVVDLIVINDNSIDIVDYKFSSLSAAKLKQKYMQQLELYKKAVELAYKKPVEHMYIYSINTGEII